MADETQDKKIYSRNLSVGLIQGMDRLSPTIIKTIDKFLWLISIFIGLIFLYLVAQILFFMLDISKHAAIDKFEDYQRLLLTFGSLIGAVTGVPFLIWRTMIAQDQNKIAQENIHSTTMVKAIEQLGAMKEVKITHGRAIPDGNPLPETVTNSKPNIEVRLGAIYLLEKLAREHRDLHWPIMEILCAYVRENAGPPKPPPSNDLLQAYAARLYKQTDAQGDLIAAREDQLGRPRVDIQAAITVIGRRSAKQLDWEKDSRRFNLRAYQFDLSNSNLALVKFDHLNYSRTNFQFSSLEGAEFNFANLEATELFSAYLAGATFSYANLQDARLTNSHLEGAFLNGVNLEDAILCAAHLDGAFLHGAHLERTDLSETHFNGAFFTNINLDDAFMDYADLREAKDIKQEMIDSTWGNQNTLLPQGIERPLNERWAMDSKDDIIYRRTLWQQRRHHWQFIVRNLRVNIVNRKHGKKQIIG